jgi:hypothetical protein
MPIHKPENVLDIGSDVFVDETSDERFDRAAFARRAIDIVRPRCTTIAICEGAARLRVESGRRWGRDPEKWALLAIPTHASRRAIALAVAQLATGAAPYALDVLMDEAEGGVHSAGSTREPTAA